MYSLGLIGAGGHARVLASLLKLLNLPLKEFIEQPKFADETIMGIPVNINPSSKEQQLILAVGDNMLRENYFKQWHTQLFESTLIHPRAFVDIDSVLGDANQLLALSVVGPDAQLGKCNIVNTHAVIEHEVVIGDFNHIAPGAKLLGRCHLGNRCFIGANAVIREGINLCDNVVVGANAFVSTSIEQPGTYVGIPARRID